MVRIKLHTPAGTSANELVQFFAAHDSTTSEARIVNADENAIEWRVTVDAARGSLDDAARERGWTLRELAEPAPSMSAALTLETPERATGQDERPWSQLEGWLMKGYTAKLKALAMQVARMELSLARFDHALEARLNAAFTSWSQHFDERLSARLQNTIASVVANETAGVVTQKTVELRTQLSEGILADIDARLTVLVDGRVRALRNELRSSLDHDLDQTVELQLLRLRTRLITELSADLEKLVELNVSKAMASAQADVDVETVRAEITTALDRVAVVENRLSASMERRVDALQQWTAEQLLGVKSCMTDREVLVDILDATVSRLRRELGRSPCVKPSSWSTRAVTPADAADAPLPPAGRVDEAANDATTPPPEDPAADAGKHAPSSAAPEITMEDLERLQHWETSPLEAAHAADFTHAFNLFSGGED